MLQGLSRDWDNGVVKSIYFGCRLNALIRTGFVHRNQPIHPSSLCELPSRPHLDIVVSLISLGVMRDFDLVRDILENGLPLIRAGSRMLSVATNHHVPF